MLALLLISLTQLEQHPAIVNCVHLTNQHRISASLRPVTLNTSMCRDAQKHAHYMAVTGQYRHSGMPYGEIIFMGPTTSAMAISGWKASPGHNAIMLGNYSQCGFGVANINGTHYWVGVFR